ncbi:MAG: GNAT family N-acetyltransferase [Myxococcales bacterium]|nr:GNAT family N-acetyltransferase [Myxococcales bacterium]
MSDAVDRPVVIRPAKPTDDARIVARCLFSSGPDVLAYSLAPERDEGTAQRVLAAGFVAEDGAFSYRYVIVAERDGALLGATAVFAARDKAKVFARTARPVLKACAARDWPTLAMRAVRVAPFGEGIPDDSLYLSQIGVEPAARGAGVGSKLLEAVFDRARKHSLSRVALHVAVDNPRAEALYARHGFRAMGVVGDRALSEKEGIPMQRVMVWDDG